MTCAATGAATCVDRFGASVSIRQHTSAYVSIHQHTSAYAATGAATGVDRFGEIAVKKAFCMAASAIEQGDLLRAGMLTDADVC